MDPEYVSYPQGDEGKYNPAYRLEETFHLHTVIEESDREKRRVAEFSYTWYSITMPLTPQQSVILYQDKAGPGIDVRLQGDTVWLSQKQMSVLFKKDVRTISEHIRNVFKDGELKPKSVIRNFRIPGSDGKTYDTQCYNLDVIISVGYRVSSKQGTRFRIWATSVLRNHLIKGFTVNRARIAERGIQEFERAVTLVRSAVERKKLTSDEMAGLLTVITDYAQSWLLLQQYGSKTFPPRKVKTTRQVKDFSFDDALVAINALKKDLQKKGEASVDFGRDASEGALRTLLTDTGRKPEFLSSEERAARLFYSIIKDRPLLDGNKRIACLLFVLFLSRHGKLRSKSGERVITDSALVALALLIAESKPSDKESILRLVESLI